MRTRAPLPEALETRSVPVAPGSGGGTAAWSAPPVSTRCAAPLFGALFERQPDNCMRRVIEVGPGTGQATTALLARGALVTAVEVGPQLAAHLERTYRRQDRLTVLNAAFEDAPLALDA